MSQPDPHVYDDPRLAAGYAFARPPVHPHIIDAIGRRLRARIPFARALDVGCGAGLSTAALGPLARRLVGVEPVLTMMMHVASVAPRASFIAGAAETLPFRDGTFDLITAAGSINYVDRALFLPEAARLLTRHGVMVIYDFAAGRRIAGGDGLDEWYDVFEDHYPPQPGYALDVRTLDFARFGLRLAAYDEMEVAVPMTLDSYLRYAMSETGVALALAAGAREDEIERWCRQSLAPVFGDDRKNVLFSAYVVYVQF
jgi:SAM-dependent methyltransferase